MTVLIHEFNSFSHLVRILFSGALCACLLTLWWTCVFQRYWLAIPFHSRRALISPFIQDGGRSETYIQ